MATLRRRLSAAHRPIILAPKKLLAICESPSSWICSACGSTESLLLSLDKHIVYCRHGDEAHHDDKGRCGRHAVGGSALWLCLDAPFGLLDSTFTPTSVGTDPHLARTVARLREALRRLKNLCGSAWERAHGWARIRLAVKLFGTPFLSRKSQLQRMQEDLRATAIRHWQHTDTARAFRTWAAVAKAAATTTRSSAAPAPAAPAPAAAGKRSRDTSAPTQAQSDGAAAAGAAPDSASDVASDARAGARRARDALHGRTGLRSESAS